MFDNFGVIIVLFAVIFLVVLVFKAQDIKYDIIVDGDLYENVGYHLDDNSVVIKYDDGSIKIIDFSEIEVVKKHTEEK